MKPVMEGSIAAIKFNAELLAKAKNPSCFRRD